MNQREKNIIENCSNNALGMDDTFQFKCRECGKCCQNREDIMLTARDLHRMAAELGRTMEYIVRRYCEVYIGESSRIPIVRLKPSGINRVCPLLRGKRCLVHKSKPTICALYPLGRAILFDPADIGAPGSKLVYFHQPTSCGEKTQPHTVSGWLNKFGLPIEDEFHSLWTDAIMFVSEFSQNAESTETPKKTLEQLWETAFFELYINYATEEDLIPQFRANMARLQGWLAQTACRPAGSSGGSCDGE